MHQILCILIVLCTLSTFYLYSVNKLPCISLRKSKFQQPKNFTELLSLSPADIERCDIGLMNLLCAQGLPGAENLNVPETLKKLDSIADYVQLETQRHEYRFWSHPDDFKNSRAYFQMSMLGTILVQDVGIRYNPSMAVAQMDGIIPTTATAQDSSDVFIHGLLSEKHFGTCASMPVLYVAIARRLHYPVNLASTKFHYYVRYEAWNNKHLNVEATMTDGFFTPADEDYKSGQFSCSEKEIKDYGWLRPLTNKEILGHFLRARGICLGVAKRYDEARQSFLISAQFLSETPRQEESLTNYLRLIKVAELGDKISDWQDQLLKLEVIKGLHSSYFENRKIQVCYFVRLCPDILASAKAINDLKAEVADYNHLILITNYEQRFSPRTEQILDLIDKEGLSLRISATVLPPPLNHGTIPQDYLVDIGKMSVKDGGAILDAVWQHYKELRPDWSNQPSMLH